MARLRSVRWLVSKNLITASNLKLAVKDLQAFRVYLLILNSEGAIR
jgi:hypothetical protein